jgi:hypothetical protein
MLFDNLQRKEVSKREGYLCFFLTRLSKFSCSHFVCKFCPLPCEYLRRLRFSLAVLLCSSTVSTRKGMRATPTAEIRSMPAIFVAVDSEYVEDTTNIEYKRVKSAIDLVTKSDS